MSDASHGREAIHHRLLLIRHGETVVNVAGVYGGSRDATLTNHGMQQIQKLGAFLAIEDLRFTHIFSSDLSRAFRTATAIHDEQIRIQGNTADLAEVVQFTELREQDYGSYEGVPFGTPRPVLWKRQPGHLRPFLEKDAQYVEKETMESVEARATRFVERDLCPLLYDTKTPHVIAVVSHGVLLANLWRCFLRTNPGIDVRADSELFAERYVRSLDRIGPFSNTGYLDLRVSPVQQHHRQNTSDEKLDNVTKTNDTQPMESYRAEHQLVVQILAINDTRHLRGLKRTKGGVGSERYDARQKSIDSFFKKH